MRVAVISLKRTPERWSAFLKHNQQALENCDLLRVDGIDGNELISGNIRTRLISSSARQLWSAGAIGAGMSHLLCWRLCYRSGSPLVVLEDDVILADKWQTELEQLLHSSAGMVLMGWNFDSMIRAEFSKNQEIISLFEPAYPNKKALQMMLNNSDTRKIKRLRNAFGLPGYWMSPVMAQRLLTTIQCLESLPLILGRGFPEIKIHGIDGLLNLHYHNLKTLL